MFSKYEVFCLTVGKTTVEGSVVVFADGVCADVVPVDAGLLAVVVGAAEGVTGADEGVCGSVFVVVDFCSVTGETSLVGTGKLSVSSLSDAHEKNKHETKEENRNKIRSFLLIFIIAIGNHFILKFYSRV